MKVIQMKVLLLPKEGHPLKRVRLTELFMREFVGLGNEIECVLTTFEHGTDHIKIPFGGGVLSQIVLPFFRLKKYNRSKKLITKNRPDIIVANDGVIEGLIAKRLSKKFGIPYAYYLSSLFYDMEKNEFLARGHPKDLIKWLVKVLLEPMRDRVIINSSIFHPISDAMGEEYEDMIKGEIFPLPLCPSHYFLEAGSGSLSDLEDGIELVYAGAVSPNRKIHLLIEIVKEVSRNFHGKVKLTIFGKVDKGSYRDLLRKRISDLGLEGNIELLNEVPMRGVPKLIRKANIGLCILPPTHAYKVSSPTKVVEYLSVGIPVVANEEIEDQRVVIKGSGGGLSPPYDIDKISRSIIELASNPEKARRMGERGRKWVLKNRSYRELALNLDKRYGKLIEDL